MSVNLQKYEKDPFSNIAVLTIKQRNMYYDNTERASEICGKFLRAAKQLPDQEFLGWQMSADEDGRWTHLVFSSPGVKVETEDFNRIFEGFAKADAVSEELPDALCHEQGKVYVLRHRTSTEWEKAGCERDDEEDNELPDNSFPDMLKMTRDARGFIRMISGSGPQRGAGRGIILLCLPDELSQDADHTLPGVSGHDSKGVKGRGIPGRSGLQTSGEMYEMRDTGNPAGVHE